MNLLGAWVSNNYQFLTVIGGLIFTNLHYKVDIEVFKVKVGNFKERLDKYEIKVDTLMREVSK